MRPLFAILGLLLCLNAMRADEQPVIKDESAKKSGVKPPSALAPAFVVAT